MAYGALQTSELTKELTWYLVHEASSLGSLVETNRSSKGNEPGSEPPKKTGERETKTRALECDGVREEEERERKKGKDKGMGGRVRGMGCVKDSVKVKV